METTTEEIEETSKLKNLVSVTKSNNITITDEQHKQMFLTYLRTKVNLSNEGDRNEFVRHTEKIIRDSNDYKAYIANLKEKIPQTRFCAIHNQIEDTMIKIEMHHGPIFTLAEIVNIVINHYIKNNKDVDSFMIAQEVLQDHFDGIIQTVFLSKGAHKTTSNKKTKKEAFISVDHAIGDIVGFIEKYSDGITYYEINKIANYKYLSEKYDKEHAHGGIFNYFNERVKGFKEATGEV